MIKWDLHQGCKDVSYLQINVKHSIKKLKRKNDMILSIDAEKYFDTF